MGGAHDVAVFSMPWSELLAAAALCIRATAFVAVAPIVGSENAPMQIRAGFAILLVIALLPVLPPPAAGTPLLTLVFGELVIGLMLGFAALLAVDVALVAGDFAGYPTGLAMAQQMDPLTQVTTPTMGVFYRVMGLLVFVAIGGHRQIIAALARSYEIVPAGGARLDGPWLPPLVQLTANVLLLGVRLAAPILIAGILCDLFLMLIVRAAPQMNILVVGAPIRLTVGLLAVAFSFHMLLPLVAESLDSSMRLAALFLQSMTGRP